MSVFAGPEIPNSGLILSLDAANPKSYPGSGTDVFDISGNNNHFTLQNASAFISSDKVFRFTYAGTNWLQRSTLLSGFTSGSLSAATFICMVKVTDNNTSRLFTFDDLNSDTTNRLNYYIYPSSNTFNGEKNNSGEAWPALGFSRSYTFLNNWLMFGAVISGTSHQFFIGSSGIFEAGTVGTMLSSPEIGSYLLIGRRGIDTNFGGDIGNFMVYNRALSAAEVAQNFNALRGRFGI